MEPVGLGVVGCGVIGRDHIRNAAQSPLVKLVAVADVREEAAREVADRYSIGTIYTDADELFADPHIEGVILALPAHARTDLSLRAFAHGKHVLTEKPVAMNAGDVKKMIQARGNLVAGCCSSRYRFLPSADVVTSFIASGALGDLRIVRAKGIIAVGEPPKSPPPVWRLIRALNGGGILANWGCYDLDYLLGLVGWSLVPVMAFAHTWTVSPQFVSYVAPGSDAETHVTALVRCQGGTVITYERGEFVAAQSDSTWQIIGSSGSLRLQMLGGPNKTITYDNTSTERGVVSQVLWQGDEDHAVIGQGLVNDFATAIREGRQPRTGLEQSLLVQRITDAIYASAEKGTAVEVI